MIFVDAWGWIALADKSDPYHRQAKAEPKKLVRARRRYVTSDFVLGEAITYLYPAIGSASAQGFINTLLAAADARTRSSTSHRSSFALHGSCGNATTTSRTFPLSISPA
jgi:predicted nucleic acid-binding protein